MVWGIFRSEVLSDVCSKASEEEIESANGESYFDIVKSTEEPSAPAADGLYRIYNANVDLVDRRLYGRPFRAGEMDALILRDLMGHKSLRTTLQYAQVNGESVKKAFRAFDRQWGK